MTKDFFISYNKADATWAEWIAWVLEEHGKTVVIQAWDFRPGGNFVLDIQSATQNCDRTIAVLSDDYLNALYTQAEWAAAFNQDPTSTERKLLPVRVAPCQPTGLLASIAYVDFVDKTEAEAEELLLAALKDRVKPTTRPTYPPPVPQAERITPTNVAFPGTTQTLPYPRNPFFTGREDQLQAIHTALAQRGRLGLSGLGGIGKTQTALEYAYRHQSEYEHVFWVRAEQETELITGYVALAKALQIPGHQQEDQQAIVALMKQWLATHDGWLLVFDNADDLRQLRAYLPTTNGHILLTTRAHALGDLANKVEATRMAANEGALLLLRRAKVIADDADLAIAPDNDQALAHALNTEMDGLPLALDQAGAYIEEQVLSLAEYLDLFRTEKAALLKERGQLDPDHPSVTVTFTMAFKKVADASPTAAALVQACAFLAPDAIPEEIFSEGATAFAEPSRGVFRKLWQKVLNSFVPSQDSHKNSATPSLRQLAENKLDLSQAIAEAARFSLISRNPQSKTLTIHRLVQEVLRSAIDNNHQRQWAEQVVEAVTAVFPDAEFENWVQCDRLMAQAQATTQLIADYGLASETAALLLSRTGYYYAKQGRYGEATPLYQQALAMRKRLLGDEHPDIATSLNDIGNLYQSQGQYSEAEPFLQKALGLYRRLLGDEHPAVANSLNNLAGLYYNQGRYGEAELLFQQALAMKKRLLGDEHPAVASSLNNLALLYAKQGRYREAEPLYQQALAMYQRLLGEEHPNVAQSLNNLAGLYDNQGRYGEAETLYQQALAMNQRLLGEEHPAVASSLSNLALLYDRQGRYGEAEPLYQQALAMKKRLLGEAHPDIATSLNNLALLYYNQGSYGEAESFFQQAVAMKKQLLGEEHPAVATSINNLAALYDNQGRYEEAESLYQKALAMYQRLFGDEHPAVATNLNNLAVSYDNQGRYGEAESLYQKVLVMRKRLLGEAHPDIASNLSNLAALYTNQGRYGEAETLYQQALAMYQRLLGEEHPAVASSLSNLALLYDNQGRYGEAETLYQQALAMNQRLLGEEHPAVANSLNNLALLYDNQGHYGEAEPLYQQALAMNQRLLGEEHPAVANSLNNLGALYAKQGRYEEAEPLYQHALAMYQRLLGEAHPAIASSLFNLGTLRYKQGRYRKAQTLLLQAQPIYLATLGPNHPNTQALQNWIDDTQSALNS